MYLEKNDPFAKKLSQRAFPDYNGKQFRVEKRSTESPFHFHNSYWDSGSRSYWAIVQLTENMKVLHLPDMHPHFNKENCTKYEYQHVPQGFAIVENYIGRIKFVRFYLHPNDFVPLLKNVPQLSLEEKIVLCITRSYKSSYRQEARQDMKMSKETWEQTQEVLKEKGFLDKRGAITVKGKNAIGDTRDYELKKEQRK